MKNIHPPDDKDDSRMALVKAAETIEGRQMEAEGVVCVFADEICEILEEQGVLAEAARARVAMQEFERQRNEARRIVLNLLRELERLPTEAKIQFPEDAAKVVRRAQAFAEAWGADMACREAVTTRKEEVQQ